MYGDDNDEKSIWDRSNDFFSQPDGQGVRYYRSDNAQGVRISKKEKSHSLRNSLIVLACIIAGLTILGVSCSNMMHSGESEIKLPSGNYIAVVYVEGTISSGNFDSLGTPYGYQHNWTLNEIDRLIGDLNNRGMVLYVDSPGGGIFESDELYCKVKEYRDITGRPVYASMASMAASGGYYISTPADKIYANRNCWTGSIGVTIGTIVDVSGFLENYGIKTTTITSGRNKSMGSYFEPLTPEQISIIQSLIDEAYDQFTGIVAEERDMNIEKVKEIADGRIYSAKQALDINLIDAVGTYDDAVADLKREYDLYGCELVDIRYVHKSLLMNLLGIAYPAKPIASGDATAVLNLLEKQNRFPVSYLCEMLAQ